MELGHTGAKGMGHTGTVKGIFHISCSSRGMRKCAANKSAGVLTEGQIRGNRNSRVVMWCNDHDQRTDKKQSKQQGGYMCPGDLQACIAGLHQSLDPACTLPSRKARFAALGITCTACAFATAMWIRSINLPCDISAAWQCAVLSLQLAGGEMGSPL